MFYRTLISLIGCGVALATEGFETSPAGAVAGLGSAYGAVSATAGHAAILESNARTGRKAMRIMGGKDKAVLLTLTEELKNGGQLGFWAERWTSKGPFDFRVLAVTPKGDVYLKPTGQAVTGKYSELMVTLPSGTTAVRFVCSSAEAGGMLVDDLELFAGAMVVKSAEQEPHGVYPMLKRAPINPVMSYRITTAGVASPVEVQELKLRIYPADAVDSVALRTCNYDRSKDGTNGMKFSKSKVFGKAKPAADGSVTVTCSGTLAPGDNVLWVDARPSANARVGGLVTIEPLGIRLSDKVYAEKGAPVTQRVGTLVAVPDAEVSNPTRKGEIRYCKTYRIPGLIRTKSGALLGCFDARYENHLDLSADIDVAVVRSEDGGQTWSEPVVAMDAGPGKGNGCGDPCILQDANSGRIWVQALATHFDKHPCLWASTTGYDPATTGQWEMVYSDDDGKTWSPIVNVTKQVKKHEWTLILAGPGCGICTSKGVLVFPAQIWNLKANPISRSTICYSTDGGKNWKFGTGVPHRTSECQVVELQDGSLMLSCRNETFQGKRVVYVTRDLGETWEAHSTNTNTLKDPACQASLVAVNTSQYGRLLMYSHPDSNPKWRNTMSVHVSKDDGKTWSPGYVYDARECWGYSCIAMVDDKTVGLFYEPSHVSETNDYHGIAFISFPLETIVTGKTEPAPGPEKK